MTELHGKKWGAQHPGTDRSVEGGVYGAVTEQLVVQQGVLFLQLQNQSLEQDKISRGF
ncbi:hypothetical protein [Pseudomonas wenzhouensis]|uniref:hypothetical protein n=1 Tax=Pseudomonas wenzhouensis TaxID=2906062 RepID=UPI001E4204D2|nr:hypothetical protein [Pseudomonas wenzhouensis]UFQ99173.1 hypothetical protein J7655_08365 [Pseudomonas wenzhouensis]